MTRGNSDPPIRRDEAGCGDPPIYIEIVCEGAIQEIVEVQDVGCFEYAVLEDVLGDRDDGHLRHQ